ncbi:MAG TPA: PaaI family thioesterase [Caldimonas sp.]|nr:PaaI family thioesterase [Caldimonas sp.]
MKDDFSDAATALAGEAAPDAFHDGPALQDRLPVHCFGCGTLNAHGLHIKSRWVAEELVCVWQPRPEHIGSPGHVYGGTIASVVDCHAVWAAASTMAMAAGHELGVGAPPFGVVTGSLHVRYLEPASVSRPLELRARIVQCGDRKTIVACSVRQGAVECATAEVVAVRVSAPTRS